MKELKATIKRAPNGEDCRYFDKTGRELFEGDVVLLDGKERKLHRTVNGELGVDATNPLWIEMGRAVECEFGIYPLEWNDMKALEYIRTERKGA